MRKGPPTPQDEHGPPHAVHQHLRAVARGPCDDRHECLQRAVRAWHPSQCAVRRHLLWWGEHDKAPSCCLIYIRLMALQIIEYSRCRCITKESACATTAALTRMPHTENQACSASWVLRTYKHHTPIQCYNYGLGAELEG